MPRPTPFLVCPCGDYPRPTLLSISGCDGSGSLTSNCLPDNAVLVFTGLNLTLLGYPNTISIAPLSGLTSSSVNFFFNQRSTNNTVNDSTIVLALAEVYQYIVQGQHYNGTVQIFFQYQNRVVTNSLYISFAPLPPPQVLVMIGRGCNSSQSTSLTVSDCVGGYSTLALTGHYYYDPLTISVGGLNCYIEGQGITWFRATYASCLLPALVGGWYDLNITTTGGTLILPQAVGMSFAPTVSGVISSQCAVDGESSITRPRMKCNGGETITVVGQQFRSDVDTFAILISNPSNASQQLQCLSPAFVSSTQVTCVLPVPPSYYFDLTATNAIAGYTQVKVSYDNGTQSSNAFPLNLYDSLNSPVFTSLSTLGCSGPTTDAQTGYWPTYTGCVGGDGLQLTITGSRFVPGSMNVQTGANLAIYCNPVPSPPTTNTSMVCRLGGFSYNTPAVFSAITPFFILNTNSGWLTSHLFYVRFAQNATQPNAPTTQGGDTNSPSAGVIAAIVVCSCLAVLVLAGVGLWQWRRMGKRGSSELVQRNDRGYSDSESYQAPVEGNAEIGLSSLRRV